MKYIAKVYDTSKHPSEEVYSDEGTNSFDGLSNLFKFVKDHDLEAGRCLMFKKEKGTLCMYMGGFHELKEDLGVIKTTELGGGMRSYKVKYLDWIILDEKRLELLKKLDDEI